MTASKESTVAACALVLVASSRLRASAGICLVRDGQPKATIVVPASSRPIIDKAARELQSYIKKMSGAELPVAKSTVYQDVHQEKLNLQGSLVVLGTDCLESPMGHGEPPYQAVGYDGFVIKNYGTTLLLAGRIDEGTLFAVYALLEGLGCRFYMPGELGEAVPKKQTITIENLDITSKPGVVSRAMGGNVNTTPDPRYYENWQKKVKLGGPDFNLGHCFDYVIPQEKYFTVHPEYFIETVEPGTGRKKRVPAGQRCISNREVIQLFVEHCRSTIDAYPATLSASISVNDGGDSCRCAQCTNWDGPNGNLGNRYLRFANEVALELEKTHPGKYVAYLARYLLDIAVPVGLKARDNVLPIMVNTSYFPHAVTSDNRWSNNFRENMNAWSKMARHIGLYDWFGTFRSSLHSIAGPDMEYYLKQPVLLYFGEITDSFYPTNISLYLTAKMLWDRQFDYREALEEFYLKFYGPASAPMREFFGELGRAAREFRGEYQPHKTYYIQIQRVPGMHFGSAEVRDKLIGLLEKARTLAKEDPYKTRVELTYKAQRALNLYVEAEIALKGWQKNPTDENALSTQDKIQAAQEYLNSVAGDYVITTRMYLDGLQEMKTKLKNRAASDTIGGFTSATSQPGWDDDSAFAGLWDKHVEMLSLPDDWKLRLDEKDTGTKQGWYRRDHSDNDWKVMKIREFWEPQLGKAYDGYAWYRVRFRIPQDAAGRRLYLAFGAVDESAWVYLNGKQAGVHDEGPLGWDKRFLIDITSLAQADQENLLAVRVLDTSGAGGVWKSVKLVAGK